MTLPATNRVRKMIDTPASAAFVRRVVIAAIRHLTPSTRCAVTMTAYPHHCHRNDFSSHVPPEDIHYSTIRYAAIRWDDLYVTIHSGTGHDRDSVTAIVDAEISKRGLPKHLSGHGGDIVFVPPEATPPEVPLCKECGARGLEVSGERRKWAIYCAGCGRDLNIDADGHFSTTDRQIHRELRRVSGGFLIPVWCEDEEGCGGAGIAAIAGYTISQRQRVRIVQHSCWRRRALLDALKLMPAWHSVEPQEYCYSAWTSEGTVRRSVARLIVGIIKLADWRDVCSELPPVETPEERDSRRKREYAHLLAVRPDGRCRRKHQEAL